MKSKLPTPSLQRSAGEVPSGESRSCETTAISKGIRPYGSVALQLAVLVASGSATFAVNTLLTSSIDGGGMHVATANYAMDTSVGGIGGIVSNATSVSNPGFIGQLTEVISISMTSTPETVNETGTSQLSGTVIYNDSTAAALGGSDINWVASSYPIASISGSGLATASAVYASTNGTFSGNYLGISSSNRLLVIDSNPDNYGLYAGDSIPDLWQIQYFGPNNPMGEAAADADGTGQNNLFKYVAGLDPTNRASIFVLKIASVTGQPTQKSLIFNPKVSGRAYTPQFRTNLVSGTWATLVGISDPTTNVNQIAVTDLNATQTNKFYRIDISLP